MASNSMIHRAASPSQAAAQLVEYDRFVDQQIKRTRSHLRWVDLAAHMLLLAGALLGVLFFAALLEHWVVAGGFGVWGRSLLFLGVLAGVGWYVARHIWPLLARRINPVYAAHTLERHNPSLKNTLLSLLLFRQRRAEVPDAVYDVMQQQAALRLSSPSVDTSVDRSHVIRVGYVVLGLILLTAIYKVASPKDPLTTAARVLAPWADIAAPTRVRIDSIQPGAIEVARGSEVSISARVEGLQEDETVLVRFSTEDGQAAGHPIPMQSSGSLGQYTAELPSKPLPGEPPGVQQDVTYWIEAGDAQTRQFSIRLIDAPTIVVQEVRYEYPPYTGFEPRTVEYSGDLRAIEGTEVTIVAQANQPISRAHVDLDADGSNDTPLQVRGDRATLKMVLALAEDRVTPEHLSYMLRFVGESGQENRDPVRYRIDVFPDYGPEVRLLSPEENPLDVRLDEPLAIEVEARDSEFALSHVAIQAGRVTGERRDLLDEPLLEQEHVGRFTGRYVFQPTQHELEVGDVVEYWAVAVDSKVPNANVAVTSRRTLKIVEPAEPKEGQPQDASASGDGPKRPQASPQQEPQQGNDGQPQGAAGAEDQANQQPEEGDSQADAERTGEETPASDQQANPQDQDGTGENNQSQQPAAGTGAEASESTGERPNEAPEAAEDQAPQEGSEAADQHGGLPQEGTTGAGQDEPPPSEVRNDGSADAEAFERIQQHFQERAADGQPNQQQTPGEPGEQANPQQDQQPPNAEPASQQRPSDAETNSGDEDPAQQPGEPRDSGSAQTPSSPEAADPTAKGADAAPEADPAQQDPQGAGNPNQVPEEAATPQSADPPDQTAEDQGTGSREPAADATHGTEPSGKRPQPGEGQGGESSQNTTSPPARPGEQGSPERPEGGEPAGPHPQPPNDGTGRQPDQDPSPSEGPNQGTNTTQGDRGEGNQGSSAQAPPDETTPPEPGQPRTQSSNDRPPDEAEAATPTRDQRRSDSPGDQGGDRTGDGQEGAGQQTPREGTGSDGQNQSADQGAGQSTEEGAGDATRQPGTSTQSERPTGDPSQQTPGDGSRAQDGQGDQPGGTRRQDAEGQQNAQPPGESPRPSDADSQRERGGEQESTPNDPAVGQTGPSDRANPDEQGPERSASSGEASGPPQGGQPSSSRPPTGPMPEEGDFAGDQANLQYARQQTDLILDRLANQLREDAVDDELLGDLGWDQDDLRRFVDRWQKLKSAAREDAGPQAQRELDDALRSLGLRPQRLQRTGGQNPRDDLRDLRDAARGKTPAEFQQKVQIYRRGISSDE